MTPHPTAFRRSYVDTPAGQVHIYLAGHSGPPVLLLHQSPQDASMFTPVLGAVGAAARAIAPDLPGYGMSDRPDPPLDAAGYAAALLAVLAAAAPDAPCIVAGVHTGAALGVELAIQRPGRVAGLFLSAPPLHPPLPPGAPRRQPRLAPPPEPRADGSHLMEAWQQRWQRAGPARNLDAFQRRLLAALQNGASGRSAYGAVYQHDLTELVGRLSCPVQIVFGEFDNEAPNVRQCLPLIPRVPWRQIDGLTIDTIDQAPDVWTAELMAFVGRVTGAG